MIYFGIYGEVVSYLKWNKTLKNLSFLDSGFRFLD